MSQKEDRLWNEGFSRACEIAEKEGVEGLLREKKFRGVTDFSGRMTTGDLDRYTKQIKELAFNTVRIGFIASLHDAFGFGEKRIQKVMNEFDKLAEYLTKGWVYWADIIQDVQDRFDLDLKIMEGDDRLISYTRPANEDFYTEVDWIDPKAWKERISFLGFTDDGKTVSSGEDSWDYENEYDKVQLYDFLGGLEYARRYWKMEEEHEKSPS